MKIFDYPNRQTDPYYELVVINQWDFISKPVCFNQINNSLISYRLALNTPRGDGYGRFEYIEELTEEMKEELLKHGYTLVSPNPPTP